MHATKAAQAARRARMEAERLFQSLRSGNAITRRKPIRVTYPHRFPYGECFVVVLVPIDEHTNIKQVDDVGKAHQHCHHAPRIINNADGTFLRLAYPFRMIRSTEIAKLTEFANGIARWMGGIFDRQAIVCPTKGIRAITHLKLRLS